MTIRQMTKEDIFVVADLERKYFSYPWSADSFRKVLDDDAKLVMVVEEDDRIIGYCSMLTVLNEGQIFNLAIEEEYRRRGIATALINSVIDEGADEYGVEVFILEVRRSNRAARNLYEKLGFEQIGVRRDYYRDPVEDAIFMGLKVPIGEYYDAEADFDSEYDDTGYGDEYDEDYEPPRARRKFKTKVTEFKKNDDNNED